MLLRLLLTSVLGLYSELCSSSVIHLPLSTPQKYLSASIRLTAIPYSCILTPLGAPCLSTLQVLGTPLRCLLRRLLGHLCLSSSYKSEPTPSDLRPRPRYDPNPCHPTPLGRLLGRPLGHPCLTPSYKFEPVPSGPAQTSILVRVTSAARIQAAHNSINMLNKMLSTLHYVTSWSRHVAFLTKIHSPLSFFIPLFIEFNIVCIQQHSGVSDVSFLCPPPHIATLATIPDKDSFSAIC
jgi:hypothetical protein